MNVLIHIINMYMYMYIYICVYIYIYIYMYNAYKKYTKHIRQSVWNKRWISNENYIPLQSLQCENGDVCWLG